MPILVPGVALRSRRPTLLVENDLALGSWLFRLAVVDDTGLESKPADLVVRVMAPPSPGPIIGTVVGPGPVIGPVVGPGPIIDPGRIVRPERASGPARTGGSGRRRTRAPKPAPEKPDRPAGPTRKPRRRRKPEP